MSKRVFDTYHVDEEETLGVKHALDEAGVEWFETEKGRWWVGSAGIWVKREEDFTKARQAIDLFQEKWVEKVRAEHASAPGGGQIRWNRVPVLLMVIAIMIFIMSFGFRM